MQVAVESDSVIGARMIFCIAHGTSSGRQRLVSKYQLLPHADFGRLLAILLPSYNWPFQTNLFLTPVLHISCPCRRDILRDYTLKRLTYAIDCFGDMAPIIDEQSLHTTLAQWGMPDNAWWKIADAALQTLSAILEPKVSNSSTNQPRRLAILPDEGFAARLSCKNDNLACLVCRCMRAELFEEMVWDNIRGSAVGIRVLDITKKDGLCITMEITGVTFSFRYFKSAELLNELKRKQLMTKSPCIWAVYQTSLLV